MKVGYCFCVFLVVEPLEVLSMAYCSYVMAELFEFSGIIRFAFASVVSFCTEKQVLIVMERRTEETSGQLLLFKDDRQV